MPVSAINISNDARTIAMPDDTRTRLIDSLNVWTGMNEQPKDRVEKKPKEFKAQKNLDKSTSVDMRAFEKKYNAISINENKIICDNIIINFFGLDDEKFLACLDRITKWGFDVCFKEFIMNYYLHIKKSNRLRNYILIHMDAIISMLKDQLELSLMKGLKDFNFVNPANSVNIEFMKQDLKTREQAALTIPVKGFNDFAPPSDEKKEILSSSEAKDFRIELMNRLRYENPKLEELLHG